MASTVPEGTLAHTRPAWAFAPCWFDPNKALSCAQGENVKLTKAMVSELMRQMGKKGGKRRLKTMTAEERQEVARKAGKASAEARRKAK